MRSVPGWTCSATRDAGRVSLGTIEQRLMDEAVARAGGNLAAAARLLGLTRAQLAYRLKASARGG